MSKSDLFIPHVKHMIDQLQKQIARYSPCRTK
jgi:hypothetical protein